jgi:uncharacterized protein YdhG (YjbR/CyaY superfamily)
MTSRNKPATVASYIAAFPPQTQRILKQIRATLKQSVPGLKEKISYRIPTLTLNGHYVIYFAGFRNHVSVYPAPRGHESFKEALAKYKGGKGTAQFPLDQPVPHRLIARIAKFRAKQNKEREKLKAITKKARKSK